MYGRTGGGGLDRFKKAQTLQPFTLSNSTQQTLSHSQHLEDSANNNNNNNKDAVGGWQAPDWAIEPRPGLFFLDVFKDGQLLERIPLDKRTHIFGRQLHSCHFVLDHQSVSRQHAALVPHKNGSLYVIDLGSAHGTFVANERLTKHSPVELEVGQSLRFAASTRVYILKKDNAPLFPPPPPPLPNLPPPPHPSDEQAVLAYNTFLNRHNLSNSPPNSLDDHTQRPSKRSKKTTRVAFRDQVGGDLVEVVGVSDGADVDTEPGPVGVKEGSSLVGKYESLVQTTVIPRGKESKEVIVSPKGVTDKLQQVLNRVKAPPKAGMYDDLYGDSLSTKAGSSWAYSSIPSGGREAIPVTSNNNIDHDDSDDDLFG